MALQYTCGNSLHNSFHVLTDDTHIIYALLKMVIKKFVFFQDPSIMKTSQDIRQLNRFHDKGKRIYGPARAKHHVVSGIHSPCVQSFHPSSRCTLPFWQVQACGCYDSLSEYIHEALSLSSSLSISPSPGNHVIHANSSYAVVLFCPAPPPHPSPSHCLLYFRFLRLKH